MAARNHQPIVGVALLQLLFFSRGPCQQDSNTSCRTWHERHLAVPALQTPCLFCTSSWQHYALLLQLLAALRH